MHNDGSAVNFDLFPNCSELLRLELRMVLKDLDRNSRYELMVQNFFSNLRVEIRNRHRDLAVRS